MVILRREDAPHYDSETEDWCFVTTDTDAERVVIEDENGNEIERLTYEEWDEVGGVTGRYWGVEKKAVNDPAGFIEDAMRELTEDGHSERRSIDVRWALEHTEIREV